ncbi:MAG TPA: hypothetical protein VFE58_19455 [Tepidisphaeraceae bacterium]|jgi:hypothetical protein|nr:hypothetical protein [Tepidisphaeraceae bacterium]
MIFLIDYDRDAGRIVSLRTFQDAAQNDAAETRLQLELDLKRKGIEREIVLLEAADESSIRKTHARYFSNVRELATALDTAAKDA